MTHPAPGAARILAVEDDPLLGHHLNEHFLGRGFQVTLQPTAEGFLEQATRRDLALVLLDILLPGNNGLDLLARLRERCRVPVIVMSALGAEQDRISGFSQGADDYLPKPFSMHELDVRVDAVLRRVAYERTREAPGPAEYLQDVQVGDRPAGLTPVEYRLFEVLERHAGEVLSKAFLYQQVLHRPFSAQDRVLDLHVSHLRRKLASVSWAGRVDTAWGQGYVLVRP